MNRTRFLASVSVALLAAAPASADGLFQDIFHGLDLAVTPSGSPISTLNNGLRINGARSGRLRVVPNRLGDGYRLELDRSFGVDEFGRPEVFDAGPYELELSGAMQSTLGFSRRNFFGNGHEHDSFFIGNGDLAINNLNYTIREKSGAQDVTLSGTLSATGQVEVNQLGFYTVRLDVSNTNSQLELDGVAVEGDTDTDYDIGPINVKGNIFYDATLAALASFGVDTTKLEKVFPNSPIDQITQNIRDSLAEQAGVLGENPAAKTAASDRMGPVLERIFAGADPGVLRAGDAAQGPSTVPEPASLALLVLGGGLFVRASRRA